MLNEGLILMSVGMGTVFSFLVILWFAVFCMSKVVLFLNKIFPEETQAPAVAKTAVATAGAEIAIAIAAAKNRK